MLLTILLDADQYPASDLIPGYHQRWEIELTFDEQKTHHDPRRASKPANLRSETPARVIQEWYALSLAHFVTRAFMFTAAMSAGIDPDRLSFCGCFQVLPCRLPECNAVTAATMTAWYAALLDEIPPGTTPPRRNRINPRVIKQKVSKWPQKRPAHFSPAAVEENLYAVSSYG